MKVWMEQGAPLTLFVPLITKTLTEEPPSNRLRKDGGSFFYEGEGCRLLLFYGHRLIRVCCIMGCESEKI